VKFPSFGSILIIWQQQQQHNETKKWYKLLPTIWLGWTKSGMILQVVMNCCIINSVRLMFVCPSLFSPSCMGWGHFSTIFCLAHLFLAQLYVGQVNLLVNKIKHFILHTNHIWVKPISIGSAFYCTIKQIHKEMSKSRLVAAADERLSNRSLVVGRWAAAAYTHILISLFLNAITSFRSVHFQICSL
jgi:hypothetical protein